MIQFFATLSTLRAVVNDKITTRDERGSITIEQVLWAVGATIVVGLVFVAIKTFVNDQKSQITDTVN